MKKKFKIVVENSAPSQGKPAKSVAWASEILENLGVYRVVDIGCGRLRNLGTLRKFFSDITLVDTKLQCRAGVTGLVLDKSQVLFHVI